MYNQWNSANVDQLVLRKGDGCVLYSGPEGRVVRNDHLVMSDIADGPALAALLRRLFIVPYFPPGRKMEPKLFSIHAPGPAPQAVSPASRRQTLTPAMARAKTNQKMLITRG